MIGFVGHTEVDLESTAVFDRLADMTDLSRWNPSVTSSRRTGGGRLQPGSTYESTISRGPLRLTATSTLVDVEQGRRVRYEGSIGPMWSIDELTFEPTGQGCLITFTNETRSPPWLRPLDRLLNAAFQPQARRAVLGARQYLGSDLLG